MTATGMSEEFLARRLGVTRKYLHRLRKQTVHASLGLAMAIHQTTGVDINSLRPSWKDGQS
jgi:transcriptional regulator with XRE-family HTH domain